MSGCPPPSQQFDRQPQNHQTKQPAEGETNRGGDAALQRQGHRRCVDGRRVGGEGEIQPEGKQRQPVDGTAVDDRLVMAAQGADAVPLALQNPALIGDRLVGAGLEPVDRLIKRQAVALGAAGLFRQRPFDLARRPANALGILLKELRLL